jgi:hypothetical protein
MAALRANAPYGQMSSGKTIEFGPAGGGTLDLNSINFYQLSAPRFDPQTS